MNFQKFRSQQIFFKGQNLFIWPRKGQTWQLWSPLAGSSIASCLTGDINLRFNPKLCSSICERPHKGWGMGSAGHLLAIRTFTVQNCFVNSWTCGKQKIFSPIRMYVWCSVIIVHIKSRKSKLKIWMSTSNQNQTRADVSSRNIW